MADYRSRLFAETLKNYFMSITDYFFEGFLSGIEEPHHI